MRCLAPAPASGARAPGARDSTKVKVIAGQALALLALTAALVVLPGCGDKPAAPSAAAAAPIVEVGVVVLAAQTVTTHAELPGRVAAVRTAQIRPQVGGIIKRRAFTEGDEVAAGALLYQIDPVPYQAAAAGARAALARAEAQLTKARLSEQRLKRMVGANLVSQQDYDIASADLASAQADVGVARAALQTATVNLGYTEIRAPIAGRIGKSLVTEGALVEAEQEAPLAVIQQLDPIYVDMTQASTELLSLRRKLAAGQLRPSATGASAVQLAFDDGSAYSHPGELAFTEVSVEPSTGAVTVRAIFPNPERTLLPGMFVRARIEEGQRAGALLVPQRAVSRDHAGNAFALVVSADDKVERRPLTIERALGDQWLVSAGLAAGDRVILDGLQKARPGAQVKVAAAAAPGAAAH